MRVNKTENNLKRIWQSLDNASSELYNALDNLASMVNLDDSIKKDAEMIDISAIDSLKQEIEFLLEEKKENKND